MKTWSFFSNVFLNVCKYSYKIALTISNYHDAQLQAHQSDAFFGVLFTLHLALTNAYTAWQAQGNKRTGSTLTLDQLLTLLSPTKTKAWKRKIVDFFEEDTPNYKQLFPQEMKPFYTGSKESRINSVKTLADSLSDFPELAGVKDDVISFHTDLEKARTIQLGNKGTTGDKSIALEGAIKTAMIEMYANLGACMMHFKTDPTQAEPYFDLETIRNHNQLVFKRKVTAGTEKNVLQHTFVSTDSITIVNDGNADLEFYLAPQNNSSKDNLQTVQVAKGATATVNLSDLDIVNTHLNVVNNTTNDGHCIVELL
jgi:hypothetical protein